LQLRGRAALKNDVARLEDLIVGHGSLPLPESTPILSVLTLFCLA
jgi:hypothetical protein